jgi:ABC-2 type transport system permease protein
MQDIGQALPSNGLAQLGWRIADGQAPELRAVLVLTAWTLGSGLTALLAYRRRAINSAS